MTRVSDPLRLLDRIDDAKRLGVKIIGLKADISTRGSPVTMMMMMIIVIIISHAHILLILLLAVPLS